MPTIGVLKVAAMPLPAPAAINTARWRTPLRSTGPSVEPNAAPTWMIGPSRPTEPPLPDGQRRGQRLDQDHDRPDEPILEIDRFHHLGHAVSRDPSVNRPI
jgi:hypothetical protein